MAVDVLVFEYHIRLTAITHFFHILTGDVCHLHIRETVVGMRIERDMDDRVTRPDVFGHAVTEVSQQSGAIHPSVPIVENLVGGKELSFACIHLLSVVGKCAVERTTELLYFLLFRE